MATRFGSQSFEQLKDGLAAGIVWLWEMGAALPEGSRFPYYLSIIKDLAARHANAPKEELDQRFDEFADVLFEAADFVDTVVALASLDLDREERKALRKRLQTFVMGPRRRCDEVAEDPRSVKPRNTALELVVASHFARAGMRPDFRGVADTTIKHDNRKVFLESKRCRSERKIVSRFREAMAQCKQRIAQSGSTVASGIAIVDFSVVANPEAAVSAFRSEDDAANALQAFVANFIDEFVPQTGLAAEHDILALMVRYSGMIRTTDRLSYVQQWAFVKNSNVGGKHLATADHIAQRLESHING